MKINYTKYHALKNDFLVIEPKKKMTSSELSNLAIEICNRRGGVGADGIIILSNSRIADVKFNIYNADGSWAEKSGNGLRIAGMHLSNTFRRKIFKLETSDRIDTVRIIKSYKTEMLLTTELGVPRFETTEVPVKSKLKFMINSPLKVGGLEFPVTCLSIGNPHTILFVDNFDFDWKSLGKGIEFHKLFPNRTNVEFVKPLNRKRIKVCDWERGAGATGSSGTGAAAAVCAGVMMGILDRKCKVQFEKGILEINWKSDNNIVELTGPTVRVSSGEYQSGRNR
jgi:diaminopimelate epimerase